jgi:alpha-beta hydrolase superfamily lysophospholipase
MNIPAIQRIILKPLSKLLGAVSPFLKLDGMLLPIYPSSIHKDNKGEWSFDKELKPIEGFPVYFKWSRAIMDAQDSLKDNSNIQIPILLMHSNDSYIPSKHEARVMTSDIVLNIDHMKKNGPSLGKNVAMVEIQNGMHDLFLSAKPVRELAMETMVKWLKETV